MKLNNFFDKIPAHIKFIFLTYLTGLVFFSVFRLILVIIEFDKIMLVPDYFSLLLQALIMGIRFDTVISGYILIIPFLILFISSLLNFHHKIFYKIINFYIILLYSLAFIICAIDIPYFHHFFSRLTVVIFNYLHDFRFIITMILQEWRFFIFFFVLVSVVFIFTLLLKKVHKYSFSESISKINWKFNIIFSLIFFVLMFVGIRGRVEEKSPIRVGTAFFSNYPIINELGLNPVFTFIQSYLDEQNENNKNFNLINIDDALKIVRQEFKIDTTQNFKSPIARIQNAKGKPMRANVVLVIMESMSAGFMKYYGNQENLTPFLDSLALNSIFFNNFYTAGIHTYNGIFSSLFGFPALMKKHPMNKVEVEKYSGLSNILKKYNYYNVYFTSHDDQFDNMSGFLLSNDFDKIVSQKDYSSKEILSTLGVPDHYLFEYAKSFISEKIPQDRNFFACILTASNHEPWIIPENIDFKPKQDDIRKKIIEYSDWSIKHFLDLCKKEKWYDSTIFVFVADHGAVVGMNKYNIPLSYFHSPLIIHSKLLEKQNGIYDKIGGQIDLVATILGLLNIEFVNNTMGVDLINNERSFIYFSNDDRFGVLNKEYLYIQPFNGEPILNYYKSGKPDNFAKINPEMTEKMRNYLYSMLQVSQYIINNKLCGLENY